jgi:hypothetical protein
MHEVLPRENALSFILYRIKFVTWISEVEITSMGQE